MENDSLLGSHLGAYVIQTKLGEGGMARVYKAYHPRLRREVAIKVILPGIADKEGFKGRFEREAQVVASLEHPHIVSVYDFGEQPELGLTYLIMQYVGGGTLRDMLRGRQPLDIALATRYARDMAHALHHAHERGIVHRDVKPQNMLISTNARRDILLSDFGIAKLFDRPLQDMVYTTLPDGSLVEDATQQRDHQLTSAGQMVGTADYMAPEQVNMQPVDARTDVYALGVVLFQMLTGQVPFQAQNLMGLLYQHVHTPAPWVRDLNPLVPESLTLITAKALAKNPQDRFQSAEEMARELNAILPPSMDELRASFTAGYPTYPFGVSSGHIPAVSSGRMPSISSSGGYSGATPVTSNIAPYAPPAQPMPPVTAGHALPQSSAGPATPGTEILPAKPHRKRIYSFGSIAATALIVAAILVTLIAQGRIPGLHSGTNGTPSAVTTAAQSFNDTFQDNHLQWTNQASNFTGSVGNNHYTITIGNTPPYTYYFPYPQAAGILPADFTLSARISRTQGTPANLYGLVFRLVQQGNAVSCYALIIDGSGQYWLDKFDAHAANPGNATALVNGRYQEAANGQNTLKVQVSGGNIQAWINDAQLDLNNPTTRIYTDHQPYSGGRPGLMVTGPNAIFSIESVQLVVV